MPSRDSQTVILSRQTILMVTAVGVGLLTLCYVLGVQVGKQSAALGRPAARGAGEDLQQLPAGIDAQLKALESAGTDEVAGVPAPPPSAPDPVANPAPPVEVRLPLQPKDHPPVPKAAADKPAQAKTAQDKPAQAKAAQDKPAPAKPAADPGRWTLQLVSTPDSDEAQRMAVRAQAAGFPATVILDNGLFKVRLIKADTREATDATALRLKNRGFKPFPMKSN
jgi:cell division septation protein DedD